MEEVPRRVPGGGTLVPDRDAEAASPPTSPRSIGSGRGITATTMASSSSSPSSHFSVTSKQSSAAPSVFTAMVRPAEAAVTGRRRTHSRRCRPPLAGRACDRHVRASRDQERLEPARGGLNPGPSAPAAPFYGGPLSAPSRPARREPAPPARAANRAWPRPGHAAPLEYRDPQGGGKGRGLLAAPLRGGLRPQASPRVALH